MRRRLVHDQFRHQLALRTINRARLPPVVGSMADGLFGTLFHDLLIGRPLMRANAVLEPASGMDPSHVEPKATAIAEAARR